MYAEIYSVGDEKKATMGQSGLPVCGFLEGSNGMGCYPFSYRYFLPKIHKPGHPVLLQSHPLVNVSPHTSMLMSNGQLNPSSHI